MQQPPWELKALKLFGRGGGNNKMLTIVFAEHVGWKTFFEKLRRVVRGPPRSLLEE